MRRTFLASRSVGATELAVALLAALFFLALCGPLRAQSEELALAPFEGSACFEEEVEEVEEVLAVVPVDDELDRVVRFEEALREVAAFDGYLLDELLAERDPTVDLRELAAEILAASDRVELEPILLALVVWNESKFDPSAVGGEDRNWCGIGQILAADSGSASASFPSFPDRPSCLQAIEDLRSSLAWSAALLASTVERPECDGSPCLIYYWGEGEDAGRNERRMWRRANTLREREVWP